MLPNTQAGAFSLARGSLRYIDGSDVNHLGWLRVREGDALRFSERAPEIIAPSDLFMVYGQALNDEGTTLYSTLTANELPYIDNHVAESRWRGTFDLPLASGDDEFVRLCRSLVFGVLMVMNARPQLVSYGKCERKQAKRGGREFWSPNVIGRGYKAQREHQGGARSSPREGWRRGHYTHQPTGNIKNNPDFISAASLPRLHDGRIDWDNIESETRAKFWRNHEHRWLEPIWVDGQAS